MEIEKNLIEDGFTAPMLPKDNEDIGALVKLMAKERNIRDETLEKFTKASNMLGGKSEGHLKCNIPMYFLGNKISGDFKQGKYLTTSLEEMMSFDKEEGVLVL